MFAVEPLDAALTAEVHRFFSDGSSGNRLGWFNCHTTDGITNSGFRPLCLCFKHRILLVKRDLKCIITCPPGRVPRLGYTSLVA